MKITNFLCSDVVKHGIRNTSFPLQWINYLLVCSHCALMKELWKSIHAFKSKNKNPLKVNWDACWIKCTQVNLTLSQRKNVNLSSSIGEDNAIQTNSVHLKLKISATFLGNNEKRRCMKRQIFEYFPLDLFFLLMNQDSKLIR